MWKVYILLSCKFRKTYIGSTNNFQKRLLEHNSGKEKFTKRYKPWIPIYLEFYPSEIIARAREKELKSAAGRRYLKKVLNKIIDVWAPSSVLPPHQMEDD